MELVAVLDALWMLGRPHEVEVFSSSEWLIKCGRGEYFRGCYQPWWEDLDYLVKQHIVDWHWIRGSPELVRAHELARQAQPDRRSA
ncbi:MAG: hypothetical protein CL610_19975 [Anaerolineaceae bacterium]|nr:hypothetical protein [Anaerolineaceae bacterium]